MIVGALFARLRFDRALIWSLLAGYLLLPGGLAINLPMLPSYNKGLAPSLAALFVCIAVDRRRAPVGRRKGWLPQGPFMKALTALFLIQPFLTVFANGDRLTLGPTVLPALSLYDGFAFFYAQAELILPFLLARRYLSTDIAHDALVRAFVAAGIAYTFPMIIELVISPQIHRWVYGFQHFAFVHEARGDGFRPVVFLNAGLWTALFISMAVIASATMWRAAARPQKLLFMATTAWMAGILALSNSLGALLLALLFAPIVRFFSARLQMVAAATVAFAVLLYPMLRSFDLVPTSPLTSVAAAIDPNRALSLQYRFDNEDILLAHANERALFGWGGWGRNRVYDPETGRDISTTDGRWVLTFGRLGWGGYLAEYGLLTLPILFAAARQRRLSLSTQTAGLCLMLGANIVDTILNGTSTLLTWLIAGAILARVESPIIEPKAAPEAPPGSRGRVAIGGELRS